MLCTMCLFELKHIFKWGKTRAKETKSLSIHSNAKPCCPKGIDYPDFFSVHYDNSLLTDLSLCALLPASQKYANHQGAIVNIMASLGLEAL